MARIKIPSSLKKFFKKEGIDDLPRILNLLATVSPVIVINTRDFPVQTFPSGKRLTNVETLGAITSKIWTVPLEKRWLVIGGYAERDASATLDLKVTDSADKTIIIMPQIAAGTTNIGFGNFATDSTWAFNPFVLDEGDKVVLTWGDAQTTPEVALLVLEIDL